MEILDIGTWELLLIIVLAFVVIGPYKAEEVSKTLGRWLNRLFKSEAWGYIRKFSGDLVNWPNKIAREAGLEELEKELQADPALLDAAPQVIYPHPPEAEGATRNPSRSRAYSPHPPPRADEAKKKKSPVGKRSPKPGAKSKSTSKPKTKNSGKRNA